MPQSKDVSRQFRRGRAVLSALALVVLVSGAAVVHADKFDEQINALRAQNNAAQDQVDGLASEASDYQHTIQRLESQISDIQAKIAANEAEQASLQQQIAAAKHKIIAQKKYLAQDITAMYIDGQLTPIEELASSNNLSEYVDKEEYRIAVQDKLDETIKEIAALQAKLEKQKAQLDNLVASQRQQNNQLASAQSRQQELLSYNQGQQAAYNHQISANSSKIDDLRQQQIAANARFIGGGAPGTGPACGGGYPARWCEIPQDSVLDDWGMYNRECVSYTAFKVHQDYVYGRNKHDMPYWGGRGNANQWDDNARAAGLRVDGRPTPGAIAVSNSGQWGHVMYVESVNGDGTFNLSQYNAALDGRYSTRYNVSPGYLVFIHF